CGPWTAPHSSDRPDAAQEGRDPWCPVIHGASEVTVAVHTGGGSRDELAMAAGRYEGLVHPARERRAEEAVVLAVDEERRHARLGSVLRHRLHQAALVANLVGTARAAPAGEVD